MVALLGAFLLKQSKCSVMKMTALSWNVLAKILKNTNRRTATAAISRNMRKVALYSRLLMWEIVTAQRKVIRIKMVADVYSHIIDEDRCINAQRLEEAFYSSKTPDPVEDTEPKTADTAVTESDESDAAKILELLKNPETAALLKQLAKAL